jgi:hypothetical protein
MAENSLSYVLVASGDFDEAEAMSAHATEALRRSGDRWILGWATSNQALVLVAKRDYDRATALCLERLRLTVLTGNFTAAYSPSVLLGYIAIEEGRLAEGALLAAIGIRLNALSLAQPWGPFHAAIEQVLLALRHRLTDEEWSAAERQLSELGMDNLVALALRVGVDYVGRHSRFAWGARATPMRSASGGLSPVGGER